MSFQGINGNLFLHKVCQRNHFKYPHTVEWDSKVNMKEDTLVWTCWKESPENSGNPVGLDLHKPSKIWWLGKGRSSACIDWYPSRGGKVGFNSLRKRDEVPHDAEMKLCQCAICSVLSYESGLSDAFKCQSLRYGYLVSEKIIMNFLCCRMRLTSKP